MQIISLTLTEFVGSLPDQLKFDIIRDTNRRYPNTIDEGDRFLRTLDQIDEFLGDDNVIG